MIINWLLPQHKCHWKFLKGGLPLLEPGAAYQRLELKPSLGQCCHSQSAQSDHKVTPLALPNLFLRNNKDQEGEKVFPGHQKEKPHFVKLIQVWYFLGEGCCAYIRVRVCLCVCARACLYTCRSQRPEKECLPPSSHPSPSHPSPQLHWDRVSWTWAYWLARLAGQPVLGIEPKVSVAPAPNTRITGVCHHIGLLFLNICWGFEHPHACIVATFQTEPSLPSPSFSFGCNWQSLSGPGVWQELSDCMVTWWRDIPCEIT